MILDEDLETVDGSRVGSWDSILRLVGSQTCECDKVTLSSSSHVDLAGGGQSSRDARRKLRLHLGVNMYSWEFRMLYLVYAVLDVCCTQCMLYLVYAVLDVYWAQYMLYSVCVVFNVNAWSWHGERRRDYLTLYSVMMIEVWKRKRGMGDEDENDEEDTSGYEKSGVQHARLGRKNLVSV